MPDCPYDLCDGSGWIHRTKGPYDTSLLCRCKLATRDHGDRGYETVDGEPCDGNGREFPDLDTDRKTAAGGAQ